MKIECFEKLNLKMKKILISAILCAGFLMNAQTKNKFLDQNFWKSNPNVSAIKTEIANGNSASEYNSNKMDATVLAINNNASFEVIKLLLEQPENSVNKVTHEGRTYLHWASMKGNPELIDYLITKGSDINLLEEHGFSPLFLAAGSSGSTTKTFDIFEKHGVDLKKKFKDQSTVLLLALPYDKDFSMTEYFVSKGLSVKDTDEKGNTAVDYAARGGNVDAMKKLIAKNVKNTNNSLFFAAEATRRTSNTIDVFKYIIEDLKVKPNIINNNGENVLHVVSRKQNQSEIIKYFLEKGLDVNTIDNEGNTVLTTASSGKDLDVISNILAKTKNIDSKNKNGETALTQAVKNSSGEVVKLLIEKGADTKTEDKSGNNLAYYWVQFYKAPRGGFSGNQDQKDDLGDKLQILQAKGIDFSKAQKDGNTLYHTAIVKTDIQLLKKLEVLKINIDAINGEGMTVLQKAALISKNDEILKYLISLGAKKDIKTEFGETAYDLASENEYLSKSKINIDFLK